MGGVGWSDECDTRQWKDTWGWVGGEGEAMQEGRMCIKVCVDGWTGVMSTHLVKQGAEYAPAQGARGRGGGHQMVVQPLVVATEGSGDGGGRRGGRGRMVYEPPLRT